MISSRSLNKAEKKLFDENPSNGRETIKLALKASAEEKFRYWDDGEDGGNSNAFLHAYWASLLAQNINENWAKKWTSAHEENESEADSPYAQMDLINNSIGIDFVKTNTHFTNDQLANEIENLVDSGKTKKIQDKTLINTTKENKRNLDIFESIIQKALSLIIKLIVSSNNLKNDDGMTPLIFAANQGELEALKLVIGYSNIEELDNGGETALFHSARLKTSDVAMFLLANGANVNAINPIYIYTSLMQAVEYKKIDLARVLVAQGAGNEFSFLRPV
jgi:hypothetical protein